MTRNESFKKRVRTRMEKTGERYVAARRALLEQAARREAAASDGGRSWVSTPEVSDEAVRRATGRGWDEWVDLLEGADVADLDHRAVASWLVEEHGVGAWWAQGVTGGWERITGRRLPGQMPDGTFTANRSRTVAVDPDELRGLLLDADGRDQLLPGRDAELRSSPTSRAIRLGLDVGVALVSITSRDDGRATVTVAHEKLPGPDEVALWKDYWGDWLAALDDRP